MQNLVKFKAVCVWYKVWMIMRGELRSVQVVYGALCVMISGDLWMLK